MQNERFWEQEKTPKRQTEGENMGVVLKSCFIKSVMHKTQGG